MAVPTTKTLALQVDPTIVSPATTITGVRPIRTPCRSARRSVATTRPNRAGPPHHPDIANPADTTQGSSNECKRAHARRAQPVGPRRRLPAAQPLRQPTAHRQRPRRVPGPLHHARSTRTGSCPRRNASAEPSPPARPTTQPWPPNPPEPDEAGARSGRDELQAHVRDPGIALSSECVSHTRLGRGDEARRGSLSRRHSSADGTVHQVAGCGSGRDCHREKLRLTDLFWN